MNNIQILSAMVKPGLKVFGEVEILMTEDLETGEIKAKPEYNHDDTWIIPHLASKTESIKDLR